jgi:hypothetical protein
MRKFKLFLLSIFDLIFLKIKAVTIITNVRLLFHFERLYARKGKAPVMKLIIAVLSLHHATKALIPKLGWVSGFFGHST